MQLKIHSDASYLSDTKDKSIIGSYFYLGNNTNSSKKTLSNGPLLCHKTVLKHVVSFIHTTLSEMGHIQDANKLKTDNTTADGIINNAVQQKRFKAMDMIFYWVKDRVEQSGTRPIMGDYFTKYHYPAHHKQMIPYYLHDKHSPMIRNDTRLAIL
jgi:hypothetical protein